MEEKPLSEQIVDDPRSAHVGYIHAEWVKEAVEKLNELFPCAMLKRKCKKDYADTHICFNCKKRWKIDKIFGEFK